MTMSWKPEGYTVATVRQWPAGVSDWVIRKRLS